MILESLVDDTTIKDDEDLWRRIHPNWIVMDENAGARRVSSAAFDDSLDGTPLSVLLEKVVIETDRTAEDVMASYPRYPLASITAETARANQQGVAQTPQKDEPAHASVFGPKTKSIKRAIAKCARWVTGFEDR